MDVFVKGFLQGSIPVVVIVGGTHYLVKRFKETRPVVYWGSLAAAAVLTYAVVEGKIKAPFMNAEEMFVDCYYCGRNIDLYDETNDSISCDECGKVACGSYKCNYSKKPKETWEDFTCGECVKGMNAETFEARGKLNPGYTCGGCMKRIETGHDSWDDFHKESRYSIGSQCPGVVKLPRKPNRNPQYAPCMVVLCPSCEGSPCNSKTHYDKEPNVKNVEKWYRKKD